jgi:hypothetical protein
MFGVIFSAIPFIGKFKRQLGAALCVGGVVAHATGHNDLGNQLQTYGVGILGVGVAHAQIKEKEKK